MHYKCRAQWVKKIYCFWLRNWCVQPAQAKLWNWLGRFPRHSCISKCMKVLILSCAVGSCCSALLHSRAAMSGWSSLQSDHPFMSGFFSKTFFISLFNPTYFHGKGTPAILAQIKFLAALYYTRVLSSGTYAPPQVSSVSSHRTSFGVFFLSWAQRV